MQLHRATAKPDWADTEPADYNPWQKLAARTNGVVTPGNVITFLGLVIVLWSLSLILRHHYGLGALGLIVGRLLDLVDGWAANKTGTKSPLGETLDAGIDKLGTVLTLVVFAIVHITSVWVLIGLALPHIIIAIAFVIASRHDIRLHPSRVGKNSMAMAWGSLVLLAVLRAAFDSTPFILAVLVAALLTASIVSGLYAATDYIRQSIDKTTKSK